MGVAIRILPLASRVLLVTVCAVCSAEATQTGTHLNLAPAAAVVSANSSSTATLLSHVRPTAHGGFSSVGLLDEARRRSATVRSLLAELERSDLVVLVECRLWANCTRGYLQFVGAGRDARLVRVFICARHPRDEQIAWLGHELQHAVEIAHAVEARDAQTLGDLFSRIGWQTEPRKSTFETAAAAHTGQVVLAEVRERATLPVSAPDE